MKLCASSFLRVAVETIAGRRERRCASREPRPRLDCDDTLVTAYKITQGDRIADNAG